jgi:DNA invertase Pin-like site-specific DNA recombinase
MSNPKTAAIYCRLARMDDDKAEFQKERCLRFAREHGYTDITVYMDNGANGLTLNRPAFKQMEAAINRGEIGTVIILSIDRLGRNVVEVLQWMDAMRRRGIELMAVHGLPDSNIMSLL